MMFRMLMCVFLFCVLMVSCEPKWPSDSTREGQWQLTEIKNGEEVKDVKAEHRFWNLRVGLMLLENPDGETRNFYRYYTLYRFANDSLYLSEIYMSSLNEKDGDDDVVMTQAELDSIMPSFGVNHHHESFRVEVNAGKWMVLANGNKTLRLIKR